MEDRRISVILYAAALNPVHFSGFGGLEVACRPLVPKFADSNPAEAVGFFQGEKKSQYAILLKGSKAACPLY